MCARPCRMLLLYQGNQLMVLDITEEVNVVKARTSLQVFCLGWKPACSSVIELYKTKLIFWSISHSWSLKVTENKALVLDGNDLCQEASFYWKTRMLWVLWTISSRCFRNLGEMLSLPAVVPNFNWQLWVFQGGHLLLADWRTFAAYLEPGVDNTFQAML